MASKTRTMRNKRSDKKPSDEQATKQSSHLSALMMLSSQLLSQGRFNADLPSFITRGLDDEQIWQQIELRNNHKHSLQSCTREVVRIQSSTANAGKKKGKRSKAVALKNGESIADEDVENSGDSGSDSDENVLESIKKRLAEKPTLSKKVDDFGGSDDSDDGEVDFDFEMDKEISKGLDEEEEENDDDELEEELGKPSLKDKNKTRFLPKRRTVVDDKFFKLSEMEQFLDAEDLKEEKRRKKEERNENQNEESDEDEDDDFDEEVDMFKLDDDADDAQGAKYSDFFDPPHDDTVSSKVKKKTVKEDAENDDADMSEEEDGGDKDETLEESKEGESDMEDDNNLEEEGDEEDDDDDEEEEGDKEDEDMDSKDDENKKSVSFEKDLFADEDDSEQDESNDTSEKVKSTFEKRQEQLQAQAREMEEASLREAPWELTGETTASKRPENSLLETVLDFQHTTRAAPVITEETTKTIEDYIKQRIKDKAFDDVERKEKRKEDPFEFKKRIVLDQEKSKMSLGELYEQEFLKQTQQEKDEVKADPECEKIEKDLKKLFTQLDALCNFRYTPIRAGTEVKILVNTPAITMEEVAPTATTDAQLLAPEEVKQKLKGELKASDERESTDKKRERRQKKKDKRERQKARDAREKAVEKMKPGLGNKYSKEKAIRQLEQISKSDKNVTLIKGDHQKLASSTSFFNQLQEEVQTNVRAKKAVKERKKKDKIKDASKVML